MSGGSAQEKVEGDYEVGYRKPPVHSRFPKGRSGNPRGRPRGVTPLRAHRLALKQAYRTVTAREGEKVIAITALEAVLRAQIALAVKGNGPAQRAVFAMVEASERELTATAKSEADRVANQDSRARTPIERARLIAFALASAEHLQKKDAS